MKLLADPTVLRLSNVKNRNLKNYSTRLKTHTAESLCPFRLPSVLNSKVLHYV